MARLKLKIKDNIKESKNTNVSSEIKDFMLKSAITTMMLEGLCLDDAAKAVGCSRTKLNKLRFDPLFQEFIEKNEVDFECRHLGNINKAGDTGEWKASAWVLERLKPEKYGKKDTVRLEYSAKLIAFKNTLLEVLNECDPALKQKVMQRLRSIDIDSKVKQIEMNPIGNVSDDIIDIDPIEDEDI